MDRKRERDVCIGAFVCTRVRVGGKTYILSGREKKRAKSDERKIGKKASERGWREGKERPIYCTNKQKYVKERRLRCNRERDTGWGWTQRVREWEGVRGDPERKRARCQKKHIWIWVSFMQAVNSFRPSVSCVYLSGKSSLAICNMLYQPHSFQ